MDRTQLSYLLGKLSSGPVHPGMSWDSVALPGRNWNRLLLWRGTEAHLLGCSLQAGKPDCTLSSGALVGPGDARSQPLCPALATPEAVSSTLPSSF